MPTTGVDGARRRAVRLLQDFRSLFERSHLVNWRHRSRHGPVHGACKKAVGWAALNRSKRHLLPAPPSKVGGARATVSRFAFAGIPLKWGHQELSW